METELVITRGLPGSGKTTWARQWVSHDRAHRSRVNRDDLRRMVDDGVFEAGVTERRIQAVRDATIERLLRFGVSVVCDDTNLPNRVVRDLHAIAKRAKAEFRIEDFTAVPEEVCITRNAKRQDKDPLDSAVISDMHRRYLRGKEVPLPYVPDVGQALLQDLYEPDESLLKAWIVDIDGTVALKGDRDPYDESRVHEDRPHTPVIELVQALDEIGYKIVFFSGRTEACREATIKWLDKHLGITRYELHMRAVGDGSKDSIMKRRLFNQFARHRYWVVGTIDDRDQVVRMWREELGLTCMQAAYGNF